MSKKVEWLEFINEEQVKEVHYASLNILESTGMLIKEESILELLHEAGAKVDFDRQHVLFPAALVESSVKKAPSRFTWYGRDDRYRIEMESNKTYFGLTGNVRTIIDLEGNRRLATFRDAENFSRLVDALDPLSIGRCLVQPTDVPEEASHAYIMLAIARNTKKCIPGRAYGSQRAKDCIRMAEIIAGGKQQMRRKPNLVCTINSVSPLTLSKELLQGMIEYAKNGLPIIIAPQVQSGATGPVTLAGTLAQHNAEALGGITVAQLLNPGVPVMYGSVSSVMDMKKGLMTYGSVEMGLLNAACAQMARFYGIPSRGSGGATDSNDIDVQAGFEGGITTMLAALGGVNYIRHSAGALESTLAVSFGKLIIDAEFLEIISRALQGIELTEKTLSLDIIDKIGPGGNFLGERHTLEHLRQEHFIPQLLSRMRYKTWINSGKKGMRELAKEKAKRLLKDYQPEPLDAGIEKELKEIVKEVETRGQEKENR